MLKAVAFFDCAAQTCSCSFRIGPYVWAAQSYLKSFDLVVIFRLLCESAGSDKLMPH